MPPARPTGRRRRSSVSSASSTGRPWRSWSALLGDIGLAEEAVQDAFATAVDRWPTDGVPPSPAGWIVTTARNRAIDRIRREASRPDRQAQAALLAVRDDPTEEGPVRDERLRLIFTCCHPALARPAQVALTLRLLGGLTTAEIARRLPGARADDGAAARAGQGQDPRRRASRTACHATPTCPTGCARSSPSSTSIFNEGYAASAGDDLVRADLCAEAVRLGRVLADLMPDEPEVSGLLALMLLTEARRPARTDPGGEIVLLADQDRSRWDPALVAEGQDLVRRCLRRNAPGPYQIQAAIAAVHSDAADAACHRLGPDRAPCTTSSSHSHRRRSCASHRAVAVAEVRRSGRGAGARRRPGRRPRPTTTCSTPSAPTCCAARTARRGPGGLRRRHRPGRQRREPGPPARRRADVTARLSAAGGRPRRQPPSASSLRTSRS